MKVFLSWSGPQSRAVAEALNDWLRRVIQAVRPFYSPEIEKGAQWSGKIDDELEGTNFGIVCLTPDNLNSPWIHFEAGALSKTKGALVMTFLLGIKPSDVKQPLGKFQHTLAEKEDVRLLMRTINEHLPETGNSPLPDNLLEEAFEDLWPRLDNQLRAASEVQLHLGDTVLEMHPEGRDQRAILEEILELLRNQERRMEAIQSSSEVATGTARSPGAPRTPVTWYDVEQTQGPQASGVWVIVAGTEENVMDFVLRVRKIFPAEPHVERQIADGRWEVTFLLENPSGRVFLGRMIEIAARMAGCSILELSFWSPAGAG